jgi:hypothetical protein
LRRHNFAPDAPELWEKARQKWRVARKKRAIFVTWSVSRFLVMAGSARYIILDFLPRGPGPATIFFPKLIKIYRNYGALMGIF